jgi:hypothetical protein
VLPTHAAYDINKLPILLNAIMNALNRKNQDGVNKGDEVQDSLLNNLVSDLMILT